MGTLPDKLLQKLKERQKNGSFRSLVDYENFHDFFSNDYLGFAKENFPLLKNNHGAGGSRLIAGNSYYTEQVELEIAHLFGYDAGLIFNSGFDANLGVLSSIPQRGDLVIYDEYCHASIRDGIRLSFAQSKSFKHNDVEDLEIALQAANATKYVIVESVYSMDGDCGPLVKIADLCQKYDAYLIVDEAHGAGIIGEKGKGLTHELGIDQHVFLKLVTFGKAYGSHGAIILASNETRSYLINYARSFIYTTALPLITIDRVLTVLRMAMEDERRREDLFRNISYFKQKALDSGLNIKNNDYAIQILQGDAQDLQSKVDQAIKQELAIKVILAPTVPKGRERIRICLHSFNTTSEMDKLINVLK